MSFEYYSVKGKGEAELIIKKSRFIAYVNHVSTAEAAESFVRSIKITHKEAAHNVFAYIVGKQGIIQKASDDGEPSGTAGRPILEVIKNKNLRNVVIVVTRYFGGKLLGAGGLVRAYSQAAVEGIAAASVVRKVLHKRILIFIDYPLLGMVQRKIEDDKDIILKDIIYADTVTVEIFVKKNDLDKYLDMFTNITSARADLEEKDEVYLDFFDSNN